MQLLLLCEILINVMHLLAHPPKIPTSRHCVGGFNFLNFAESKASWIPLLFTPNAKLLCFAYSVYGQHIMKAPRDKWRYLIFIFYLCKHLLMLADYVTLLSYISFGKEYVIIGANLPLVSQVEYCVLSSVQIVLPLGILCFFHKVPLWILFNLFQLKWCIHIFS